MDVEKRRELKEESKRGSMGALVILVESMRDEAQKSYNVVTNGRYEYFQSRLKAFDEVIELLPEASE